MKKNRVSEAMEELNESIRCSCTEESRTMSEAMSELIKMSCGIAEIDYQMKHRKVKDRWSSSKFYANNFKKNRKKK